MNLQTDPPKLIRNRRSWVWLMGVILLVGGGVWIRHLEPSEAEITAEFGLVVEAGSSKCPWTIYQKLPLPLQRFADRWKIITGLFCGGLDVTDDHLIRWGRLRGLQRLHLDGTHITDAGLVHLGGLENLQDLNLAHTSITDSGLMQLSSLNNLVSLNLEFTSVTDDGLAAFRKRHPRCRCKK